jgi:uncharacterized protein
MNYGISDTDFQAILTIFRDTSEVEEVILYGSRAKGTHRPGSDIDLAVKGPELTHSLFIDLLIILDELDLLYRIDVVRYESIKNQDLLDHIRRVGVRVYAKQPVQK